MNFTALFRPNTYSYIYYIKDKEEGKNVIRRCIGRISVTSKKGEN